MSTSQLSIGPYRPLQSDQSERPSRFSRVRPVSVPLFVSKGRFMKRSLNVRLCDAVWSGDLEVVQELILLGADVDCFNDNGNTPLHLAVEQGRIAICEALVRAGADVNLRTEDEFWTPVLHAVEVAGDVSRQLDCPPDNRIIELLVRSGADVNARTTRNESALYFAKLNTGAERILREAGACGE
jgi:ankyrin repeat protein